MSELRDEEGFDEEELDDLDDEPIVEQLRDLYGSNAAVATAAGAPTSAEAAKIWRAKHPKAPRNSANEKKVRAAARTRRQSFLRNLQRYEAGTRRPRSQTERLERLRADKVRERREAGSSLGGLARVFQREGVTVSRLSTIVITVSSDTRERGGISKVTFGGVARVSIPDSFIDAVSSGTWANAGDIFFDCWGQAYGIGYVNVEEIGSFELEVGNDPGAYGFARAA